MSRMSQNACNELGIEFWLSSLANYNNGTTGEEWAGRLYDLNCRTLPSHWLIGPIEPVFKDRNKTKEFEQLQWTIRELEEYIDDGITASYQTRGCYQAVTIDPDGTVWWCVVKVGNLYENNLIRILADAINSPVYRAIKDNKLIDLARNYDRTAGTKFCRRTYVSRCHLCYRLFSKIDY